MPNPIDFDFDTLDNDAAIDRYHDGYGVFLAGGPCPFDDDMAEGWRDAERASRVRVFTPRRPEGYYHAPIGAFD